MKKIVWLSICFICLLSLSLRAEVVPLDTIPFELGTDSRLYVTVYINGQDDRPLRFLLDTGGDGCGAQFQFAAHRRAGHLYGKCGEQWRQFGGNHSFHRVLSGSEDGVLGNNFLQRFNQLYDFKNDFLYLEVNDRLYTPFYDFLVR